jgi:hypothetical protein
MVVNLSPASADTGGAYDPSNFALAGDPLVEGAAVTGVTLGAGMTEGQAAGMLLNKIRYAKGWTAVTSRLGFGAAQINGDATAATQISQMERAFAPVASKLAPLVNVAGTVATGVMAANMGISLGAFADRAVGVDVNGGLCADSVGGFNVVNTLLAWASDTNCTEWKMSAEMKLIENRDQLMTAGGPGVGSVSCTDQGWCATITSWFVNTDFHEALYCVSSSASGLANNVVYPRQNYSASGAWSGSGRWTGAPVSGCPAVPGAVSYYAFAVYSDYVATPDAASTALYSWEANGQSTTAAPVVVNAPAARADPGRTLRCDIKMSDNSVLHASTAVFHQSTGSVPPYVCPAIPPAAVPVSGTVWETTTGAADTKWADVNLTAEYQTDRAAHPDCTVGQCRLDLIRVSDSLKCLDAGSTCDGWFADPNKTTDYKCTLGPYDMPIASCNAYSPTFNQQKVAAGTPYADPKTGTEVGQTVVKPLDPASGADPQTGECFPTGWGVLNPVEWVVKPVSCALQFAFVPTPSVVDSARSSADSKWQASTPGKLIAAVGAVALITAPSSGCQGVAVPFPTFDMQGHFVVTTHYFMAACPGDFFAPWAPLFSVFIGGAFAVAGFFGIRRTVSQFVGLSGEA